MKLILNYLSVVCFVLLLSNNAVAQYTTKKQHMNAAEKAWAAKNYKEALVNYQEAYEFDHTDAYVTFKIGESARMYNSYTKAEIYYSLLQLLPDKDTFKQSVFYLGEMQMLQGKYPEAETNFNLFITENQGDNAELVGRARQRLESIEWAKKNAADSATYFTIEHMGADINTPYSEFAPFLKNDTLYYSSNRFENPKNKWLVGKVIMKDSTSNDTLGSPINFDKSLHTVNLTFSPDGKKAYFSVCNNLNYSEIRCELYSMDIVNGVMGTPKKLPQPINMDGTTSTQPSIGKLAETGKTYLFFTSDRPGGVGKDDIWYSEVNGDSYGTPVNLDVANTAEADITPFLHEKSSTLYFSSFGQKGFGGYDVYSTQFMNGKWQKIEQLPAPLNSSFNDIYYMEAPDSKVAYFASNRTGTMYLEPSDEACCNDLYKVNLLKVNLLAFVFEAASRDSLPGAQLALLMRDGTPVATKQYDALSSYTFPLDNQREYMAIASKPGYFPDTVYFSTKDLKDNADIVKLFYLRSRILELDILTFAKRTGLPLNGTTIRITNPNGSDKEQMVQLPESTNEYLAPLVRNQRYLVIAAKKGYAPDSVWVDTRNIADNVTRLTQKLYLGKGNLEDYLPIELYFDNDEPGRATRTLTTNKTFPETYTPYYNKKWLFRDKYTKPLSGEQKIQAEKTMNNFFDNKVKKGNDDLIAFTEALDEVLDRGESVEIVIQGFTSPLASSEYNEKLGARRVNSVVNYLQKSYGGSIAKYISSGKLKISQVSYGESKSPADVVSSYSDLRNSVYGVPASRERRVEIVNLNRSK